MTIARKSVSGLIFIFLTIHGSDFGSIDNRLHGDEGISLPVSSPKDATEGLERLEKLLGRYTADDIHQWRFEDDFELTSTMEAGKPVVIAVRGIKCFGSPYRVGEILLFEAIVVTKRSIYDLKDGDKRTLSRHIQNQQAIRYRLERKSTGDWFYESRQVVHNLPEYNEKTTGTGRVNWLPNGIDLEGTSVDSYFEAGGKMIMAGSLSHNSLTRDGDQLIAASHSQTYHLIKDLEGRTLPFPDFTSPFGQPNKTETKSVKDPGFLSLFANGGTGDPKPQTKAAK